MESRMMELMEAIQESEGQAERRVLTLLGGRYISEKALVIDGKIVWESRKNGYFHGYTDEIKNITESGITYIGNEKVFCLSLIHISGAAAAFANIAIHGCMGELKEN